VNAPYASGVRRAHPDLAALPEPWRPLHELRAATAAEVEVEAEQVYVERGIEGVRPRFTVPHQLTVAVEELRRALKHRSMRQRILQHLVEPP
jgi:hypothetical protein